MDAAKKQENAWENEIKQILPPKLFAIIENIPAKIKTQLTEIRLRVGQPLLLVLQQEDAFAAPDGKCPVSFHEAYFCTPDDITKTFQLMSKNSVYAYGEELKSGYLTIEGGHRVGLAGQAIVEAGEVKALKNICFLNIRIAKDVKNSAAQIIRYLLNTERELQNTLIISPPRCGKTTLLRSLVRLISYGMPEINFAGLQTGVVDERSEIAACCQGLPKIDLGPRTDVLDACPKATGLLMLIRSMSPSVVVTDELGRQNDADAVREALYAGVKVITTAHGKNIAEIKKRPYIGALISEDFFTRYIILSSRYGPGTVEEIFDAEKKELLYKLTTEGEKLWNSKLWAVS
jgi:stage III sporulation protein AA